MFRGGPRFMAFQGFSWSFFAISLRLGSGIVPSHQSQGDAFPWCFCVLRAYQ